MELAESRIVVMRPGELGAGAVLLPHAEPHEKPTNLVSGHDVLLYVARGHGSYHTGRQSAALRPNLLVSAPAGSFECELDADDHEVYLLAFREPSPDPDDKRAFTPSFARILAPRESHAWHERLAEHVWLAEHGLFRAEHVTRLKCELAPLIWRSEHDDAQATLSAVFHHVWERIDEALSLEALARYVGYSANYLNDLARLHTGRPLGRWIADMRMARARAYLERTDVAVADIGAACGYDDPAYFSRVFRREHGVPPAIWRIAARPDDARFAQVALTIDELHARMEAAFVPQRAYSFAS